MIDKFYGEAQCDLCKKFFSTGYKITIIKHWEKIPKLMCICYNCSASKNFFYIDNENNVKFNYVKLDRYSSSITETMKD